jgi:hypothetical protein
MKFVYEQADPIPKLMKPGVVYHDTEFELAELLCPCGCGHRITLLVPDGHQISVDGTTPSVSPSIAVCDAPCGSHFFIREGEVDWLAAFSPSRSASVMGRQVARHVATDLRNRSRWERFRRWVSRTWDPVRSSLRF